MFHKKGSANGPNLLFLLVVAVALAVGAFLVLTPNPMEEPDAPEISYPQNPAPIAERQAPPSAQTQTPESTEQAAVEEAQPQTPPEPVEQDAVEEAPAFTYALNTNTMKIHKPNCSSVNEMSPRNLEWTHESVEELQSEGYAKCKRCF